MLHGKDLMERMIWIFGSHIIVTMRLYEIMQRLRERRIGAETENIGSDSTSQSQYSTGTPRLQKGLARFRFRLTAPLSE